MNAYFFTQMTKIALTITCTVNSVFLVGCNDSTSRADKVDETALNQKIDDLLAEAKELKDMQFAKSCLQKSYDLRARTPSWSINASSHADAMVHGWEENIHKIRYLHVWENLTPEEQRFVEENLPELTADVQRAKARKAFLKLQSAKD